MSRQLWNGGGVFTFLHLFSDIINVFFCYVILENGFSNYRLFKQMNSSLSSSWHHYRPIHAKKSLFSTSPHKKTLFVSAQGIKPGWGTPARTPSPPRTAEQWQVPWNNHRGDEWYCGACFKSFLTRNMPISIICQK